MATLILITVMFGCGAICLAVLGVGRWADMGLNLVAEAVGIAMTYFVIDALLKRDSERRAVPQKLCAYRDIRGMANRMLSLYQMLYSASGRRACTLAELLNEDSYHQYMGGVILDDPAPIMPARSWLSFFTGECNEFRNRASMIMLRYSDALDPEAYEIVHQLHDQTWDPGLLTTVVAEARKGGSKQFSTMSSLLSFPSAWMKALEDLIAWLDRERVRLARFTPVMDKPLIDEIFSIRQEGGAGSGPIGDT